MTRQTKATLKGYFNTGDMPTESNFGDLIDSMTPSEYLTVGPYGSDADYICDGTDDQVQIQAAIDQIATIPEVNIYRPDGTIFTGVSSRGSVTVLRGGYSIGGTITIKTGVHLILTENAFLFPVVDVDMIRMKPGSSIDGGGSLFAQGYPAYSKNFIYLDGDDHFAWGETAETFIRDITIRGGANQLSTGIYMFASDPVDQLVCIFGVQVANVCIIDTNYGVKLQQWQAGWVAANTFTHINVTNANVALALIGPQAIDSRGPYNNMFIDFFIEVGLSPNTHVGIFCDGWENYFRPVMIWDVDQINGTALNFTNFSFDNRIEGRIEAPIIDNGTTNVIVNYGF